MSLSIRYYTQISIAWLNQLDVYLSSIHVPALSCQWRLLERHCFLLWRCSVLRQCMFLGCSCTANPRSVLVSHSVFLFKLKAINLSYAIWFPQLFKPVPYDGSSNSLHMQLWESGHIFYKNKSPQKSSLRGRVLGTKSSGRQQQESIPHQNQLRGSKKRASSNHDQDGSRKAL